MTAIYVKTCVATIILSLVIIWVYKNSWRRFKPGSVPTGIGVVSSIPLFVALALCAPDFGLAIAGLVLIITGAVYWIDDLSGLRARIRLVIAFFTGLALSHIALSSYVEIDLVHILTIVLLSGFLNLVFVNSINFYDGADLNVATFIVLQCSFIIFFLPLGHWMHLGSLVLTCFVLPFMLFNRHPENIYFGDAGCFVFAGFLILIATAFFVDPLANQPEIFIPLSLPLFDVAFVLTQRVWQKHDLLRRHYMHLYQRLQRRFNDRRYLISPSLCSIIILAVAATLENMGVEQIFAVGISMILVTPIFYFTMRAIYVAGEPEGPLQEERH